MVTVMLNSEKTLNVYWIDEIRTGQGGVMLETPAGDSFAELAQMLEDANSLAWVDDAGAEHTAAYASIRHMTRDYGKMQVILDKAVTA